MCVVVVGGGEGDAVEEGGGLGVGKVGEADEGAG